MSKGKISRGKGVKKYYWVAEDIALVKRGIVPEGRTYIQAASYAHKHGIPRTPEQASKWIDPSRQALLFAVM